MQISPIHFQINDWDIILPFFTELNLLNSSSTYLTAAEHDYG
jgi:hypothetical protein